MKQQVFFIHGAESYSNYEDFLHDLQYEDMGDPLAERPKRWYQTLKSELADGYEVYMPSMPNKENAKYLEWKFWFERHFEFLRDEVILVGHSQGAMFLTKYVIENTTPFSIKALLLVAAPWPVTDRVNDSREDGGDFTCDTARVRELAQKTDQIVLFHSKDDFVVPYEHALKYKAALPTAELVTFEDKNHFLIPQFPELLEIIRTVA